MLAQHLDDSAVAGEFTAIVVLGKRLFDPKLLGYFIDRVEPIRRRFVGTKNAKRVHVQFHHIAQKNAQGPHVVNFGLTGLVELGPIIPEVRQSQILLQQPAIGVRVCTHPASAGGRQLPNRA